MSETGGKNWTMDDIDRLLSRTEKSVKRDNGAVADSFAGTAHRTDTVTVAAEDVKKTVKAETAENKKPAEEKTAVFVAQKADKNNKAGNPDASAKMAKQRVADAVKGVKDTQRSGKDNGQKQMSMFDEPLTPKKEHAMETDENRRRFLEVMKLEDEKEPESDTKVIERSGFVMKRGKVNLFEGLEEAPKIVDADDVKKSADLFESKEVETENWSDGQIKFSGFESQDEMTPDKISEEEAQAQVRKKRREKVNKFKLMGIAEAEESEKESDKNIEKLFTEPAPVRRERPSRASNNAGVEYNNSKDANRIRGTIDKMKKESFIRMICFASVAVIMLILNIVSSVVSGHDTVLTQILNLALLAACFIVGIEKINSGILNLLKRKPDMNSAMSIVMLAALVQNICLILSDAFLNYHMFMISACVPTAFALNELGEYLRHLRTMDAFNYCTGKTRKKLYSIQEIENKNEKFEIGRNLLMDSPDIRYSCRAKFPSKLIEQCETNVSSDKLQALLIPIVLIGGAVCGLVGGIVGKNVFYGISVFASAVCICLPAFGVAAIQLPLRWANKRLNNAGGLITSQDAVDDYSKANSIVLDSAELFDSENCRMHGFKDFKNVRVDDIMLYAAAMVVRSGGPLANVFDQVVSNRDLLPTVQSFSYEDRMGISGWIDGQKVIMGNKNMMKHHNLEISSDIDEEKYTHGGRKVIYLAIANSLAAMLVVSYAPNKKLTPFIKRLGTDGVTILLRNNDSNITTDMINDTFGVNFDNIRLMSNTAGRLYKKYRSRVREHTKSGIIHDGTAFSFMRSFTMSYSLCGTFKVENLIQLINVIAGIVVVGVLAVLKIFNVVGMWPLMVFQLIMSGIAFFMARLRGIF